MENKKKKYSWPTVTAAALLLLWLLREQNSLRAAIRWAGRMLSPFLWGGALAFVLHVPLRGIEQRLPRRWKRFRRAAALLLTILSVLAVLAWVLGLMLPHLAETAVSLGENLPRAWGILCGWFQSVRQRWPFLQALLGGWQPPAWQELLPQLAQNMDLGGPELFSSTVTAAQGVANGAVDFFIGLAFALYLLAQKEKLAVQCRMLLYAFVPQKRADRALEVARLAEKNFSHFLSGQCLEACILGCMFAAAMLLCRMPYVTLISVLIAITALVPVFGSLAGCVLGTTLIAVQRPGQALWFVLLFLCVQQIEGSLVYPRVVGSSVGLPPIWVLAAVTLGGNLLGVPGILVMIPLCSVLYALLRQAVHRRLQLRQVPKEKYQQQ